MFFVPRQHLLIEHVWRSDGVLALIQLDYRGFAVAVDEGLLVDPAQGFDVPYVIGVLPAQLAGMLGFNLTVGLFFFADLL